MPCGLFGLRPNEIAHDLLEAGMATPSASQRGPWQFVDVRERAERAAHSPRSRGWRPRARDEETGLCRARVAGLLGPAPAARQPVAHSRGAL